MSVQEMELPPLFVDSTEIHADPIRSALSGLLGDQIGLFGVNDFAPTVNPDYTLTVGPGRAAVPTPATGFRGVFLAESRASVTLPITPPHATRDRIDVVVVYAVPPATAQDRGKWFLEIRTGEPATQPVAPTVPGAMLLHELRVRSEADGRAIQLTDWRHDKGNMLIAGAAVYGAVKPANPVPGMVFTDGASRVTSVYMRNGEWVRLTPTPPTPPRPPIGVHLTIPGNYLMNDNQVVNWTSAPYNPAGMWSPQNPQRIIVPESGLYAFSATFAANTVAGGAQIHKTIVIMSKYSAETGGTQELIAAQDGAAWGADTLRWEFFGAYGTVGVDKGQSLGMYIETAVVALRSPAAFTTRLSVWKVL